MLYILPDEGSILDGHAAKDLDHLILGEFGVFVTTENPRLVAIRVFDVENLYKIKHVTILAFMRPCRFNEP